jgi:predicted dehydrogenase
MMADKISVGIVGLGSMARFHLSEILKHSHSTIITAVCEPSQKTYQEAEVIFSAANQHLPPNQPNFELFLTEYADQLDAVFIISPHVYHHDQAAACLEAGLDVLLEKPMVMNRKEAISLINIRDQTGRLLVVAFQGSLSPQIRTVASLYEQGELGKLQSISATVWQNWGEICVDTWRQDQEVSGGGFLFDTGAHMLNTVVDLAGEKFGQVSAWLENNNRPVETQGVVLGRLTSGVLVTLHASGETIPTWGSNIYAFYSDAIVRTGIWGEYLEIQYAGDETFEAVDVPPSLGVWEQFLVVRMGELPNPSPPEVGLRMAYLYEAIKQSAAANGKLITID